VAEASQNALCTAALVENSRNAMANITMDQEFEKKTCTVMLTTN